MSENFVKSIIEAHATKVPEQVEEMQKPKAEVVQFRRSKLRA